MQRKTRRLLTVASAAAALTLTAPVALATQTTTTATTTASAEESVHAAARPAFRMPFHCGQRWLGSNWHGHSPAHSIDWNHYDANGNRDDLGRRVFASAKGTVLASYYSTNTGYGNTIVIGHGNGWQTRYAHLKTRAVQKGAKVKRGQKIGRVGATSATGTISAHLHYEQIHNGSVVVSVVQGLKWKDGMKRYQVSKNRC